MITLDEFKKTIPFRRFYKKNNGDKIWWIETKGYFSGWFSFDKKTIYHISNYPDELTAQQKDLFDKENPYWVKFFKERNNG